jgi:predicted heme/steroid binding protein
VKTLIKIALISTAASIILFSILMFDKVIVTATELAMPVYSQDSLKLYDGTNQSLPVYMAYEGYVYDVSAGREDFYNVGKDYHYLAGRDSTDELNLVGGSIIKKKYKIVGTYK